MLQINFLAGGDTPAQASLHAAQIAFLGPLLGSISRPFGGKLADKIGAAVGAVAGGLAGKAIAERINPSVEDTYWRSNYSTRPYVASGSSYDDYSPAYKYGYERYPKYHGRSFDEVEDEFSQDWDSVRGKSRLAWKDAKHATRDAYERAKDTVERAIPGDSDNDGR